MLHENLKFRAYFISLKTKTILINNKARNFFQFLNFLTPLVYDFLLKPAKERLTKLIGLKLIQVIQFRLHALHLIQGSG